MATPEQYHREFFRLFVRRDLSMRYAGSTLGVVWNLVHPLVMIGIYMMIFATLMQRGGGARAGGRDYGGMAYAVHLCAGIIPWLLFSDVLTRSVGVLLDNGNFLQKVSFPPIVLFTALLLNGMMIYGAAWFGFLLILLACGQIPPATALLVPAVMFVMGLAGMGIGLLLSGLNVFFRDTGQVLTVAMQVLFWLNPIVYTRESINAFNPAVPASSLRPMEHLGRLLFQANPLARFIEVSQGLMGLESAPVSAIGWAMMLGFTAASLTLGILLFRRMLPDVRDCL